jgi:hypothetical protein
MKKNKHQQRIFKKVIKKVSKGYFKDFENYKTLFIHPDDANDHTLKKELNDHTKPEEEKPDSSKN